MRVHGQAAFVLHHRAYGETSMLVELFTREHGRIGAIAKGARRPRAQHGNILIPFQPLIVDWSGKGELVVFGISGPPRTAAGYAQLKKK